MRKGRFGEQSHLLQFHLLVDIKPAAQIRISYLRCMKTAYYQSNKGWNDVRLSEYFDSVCIEDLDDKRHLFTCKQAESGKDMDYTHQ